MMDDYDVYVSIEDYCYYDERADHSGLISISNNIFSVHFLLSN